MVSFFISRSNELILKNERGDTFFFKKGDDGEVQMVKYCNSPMESFFLADERNFLEAIRKLFGNGGV